MGKDSSEADMMSDMDIEGRNNKSLRDYSDKDYKTSIKYIKNFFEKGEYEYIVYLLNDNISLIEFLKEEDTSLYFEIFSNIFCQSKVAFQNISEILPYIDLKKIIIYMEEQIKFSIGDERETLISLHDFYSITLYGIILLRDFSPIEIFALDPLVFQARIIPHKKKKNVIDIILNNQMYNHDIDKEFFIKTLHFSKDYAGGYTDLAEYLVSEDRPSEFFEVFEKVHNMILNVIKTDEDKKIILERLRPVLDIYENSGEYETMSRIVDIIKSDYHEIPLFSKIFLHSKFKNRECDELISFVSSRYTGEEIKENPELAHHYGTSLVQLGKISEGHNILKSAYEISGYHPYLLIPLVCAQYHKDKQKIKKILKNHFEQGYPDLAPEEVFLLLQDFVEKEPDIANILFEYLEDKFDKFYIDSRNILNYHYLLFKLQYFLSKEEYDKYIKISEELIDKFPQLPGGYSRLADLYIDKESGYFDLEKALEYDNKQSDVEGIPVEYFQGITYTKANEPNKAIEKLEFFVNNYEISFRQEDAYQYLSLNNFSIGEDDKGCYWGDKWFERYDTPQKAFWYLGSITRAKHSKQSDYEYMLILSEKCWKLKEKLQPEINRLNLETDRLDFARNYETEKREKERLKQEIERLEDDIKLIKQKYVNIEDLDEDDLQDIFSQIREKFVDISDITRKLNEDEYLEVKRNIGDQYPNIDSVPEIAKKILWDTEFMLKVKPPESDFSGLLVNLGKVVEIILDEKISKPFMEKVDQKDNVDWVNEKVVFKLFPHGKYKRQTIALGGWCYFIRKYIEESEEPEDKVTRKFIEELKSVENIRNLKSQIVEIKELRNGAAHNRIINKNDIKKDVKECRLIINKMIENFYSET